MISPIPGMIDSMWHDSFDLGLATVALLGLGASIWAALDHESAAACWLGRIARVVGGRWPLALAFASAILFAAVAEDVLRHESDEWVVRLDQSVQTIGRDAGRQPYVHAVARGVSLVTGFGLGILVVAAAGVLAFTHRRPAAVMLMAGTAGGWIVYGTAKLIFRVHRPSLELAEEARRGYGFPSGHTVVTVVALGLLAWICGRGLTAGGQRLLYAAAIVVALLTGASRILLHAHWLSDVVAGVALGTLYLALVVGQFQRTRGAPAIPHTGGS
jgi:membrane-associated phospholipid phosphatase